MAEKILVVDDEYLLLNMLVETLKSKGYETFCASDGFEAMRMMAEVSRDLIITDVMMPELDGHKFTQYVRRVSDIPVIIMTGVPEDNAVLREKGVKADA